jgi:hypothetical protein
MIALRIAFLVVGALLIGGCAGFKMGGGYKFNTQEFFLQIERPLESGLKK